MVLVTQKTDIISQGDVPGPVAGSGHTGDRHYQSGSPGLRGLAAGAAALPANLCHFILDYRNTGLIVSTLLLCY